MKWIDFVVVVFVLLLVIGVGFVFEFYSGNDSDIYVSKNFDERGNLFSCYIDNDVVVKCVYNETGRSVDWLPYLNSDK